MIIDHDSSAKYIIYCLIILTNTAEHNHNQDPVPKEMIFAYAFRRRQSYLNISKMYF